MTVIKICSKRALKVIALSHINKKREDRKTIRSHAIQKQMLSFKSSSAQISIIIYVFRYSSFFLSSFIVRIIFDSVDLLQSFIKLTACPNDLLRSQGAMLKYLHIISSDLTQVYDAVKLRWVKQRRNKRNFFRSHFYDVLPSVDGSSFKHLFQKISFPNNKKTL